MNWRALPYDYKLLRGDPMLILSMAVPFILWGLMQYLFPWLGNLFLTQWSIDITSWYTSAGTFFVLLIPMMFGMVYGFILLDERDGGIITAISVTPTGKSGYLQLRLGFPLILSLLFVFMFLVLLQLTGSLGILQIILISALTASQALLLLLFLGAFADNKVMGMAIAKGFGLLLMGPVLDFVLPSPYFWIGAYSPLFWSGRALLAENSASFWLFFCLATIFHGALLWILFRKFISRND